jgi:hypothetical protein
VAKCASREGEGGVTLTKKSDVLAVLQAGGYAIVQVRSVGFGMAELFDASGMCVRAWQQAIISNLNKCKCSPVLDVKMSSGRSRRWELKS